MPAGTRLKGATLKLETYTGSSSTGKSNIYSIIDYCLLSGNVNIVYPVINENAEWYGLEFLVNNKYFAVARKKTNSRGNTARCIYPK